MAVNKINEHTYKFYLYAGYSQAQVYLIDFNIQYSEEVISY